MLRGLRPRGKTLMVLEARRDPAWEVLRSIPFVGPVRVSLLLATMKTPWRFWTKRNLWAYAGLAVVTEIQRRSRVHCWAAGASPAQTAGPWPEPEPQSRPQGGLQECGYGRRL